MPQPKYITVNGVMKKNPKYASEVNTIPTAQKPLNAIAVVSSPDEIFEASEIQLQSAKMVVPMEATTSKTIEMLQKEETLQKYQSPTPLDGGEIIDKIGEKFTQYATPFGLINQLIALTKYKLDFLIDDSGSMSNLTDVDALEASEPVKSAIRKSLGRAPYIGEKMTRLQEAEDRLHIMISILAYIPFEHIQIRFLNSRTPLILERKGKTPGQFEEYAHKVIRERFASLDLGTTPVADPLQAGFDYSGSWSHYLFNDGEPDEGGEAIAQQIIKRKNPEDHPLTLISCTNRDEDTEWMKWVDGKAKFVAEVDDHKDELREVQRKQGEGFPYTRGIWILCQLVAAITPDLDALDENLPLTNYSLSKILGRQLNPYEYQYYFERNPNAALYVNEYSRFLEEEGFASQIISKTEQERREQWAGYVKGERPNIPLANISSQLTPISAKAHQIFLEKYSANQLVQELPTQLSSISIAPHQAFMPSPMKMEVSQHSYESSMSSNFK
ncbi:hypothetical protein [Legionella sp. WA2022007384]